MPKEIKSFIKEIYDNFDKIPIAIVFLLLLTFDITLQIGDHSKAMSQIFAFIYENKHIFMLINDILINFAVFGAFLYCFRKIKEAIFMRKIDLARIFSKEYEEYTENTTKGMRHCIKCRIRAKQAIILILLIKYLFDIITLYDNGFVLQQSIFEENLPIFLFVLIIVAITIALSFYIQQSRKP